MVFSFLCTYIWRQTTRARVQCEFCICRDTHNTHILTTTIRRAPRLYTLVHKVYLFRQDRDHVHSSLVICGESHFISLRLRARDYLIHSPYRYGDDMCTVRRRRHSFFSCGACVAAHISDS